ncbi:hypothetical protein KI387_008949, partial [Taxus chinensis]
MTPCKKKFKKQLCRVNPCFKSSKKITGGLRNGIAGLGKEEIVSKKPEAQKRRNGE